MSDRYEEGLGIRRRVLGDAHVDASLARAADFGADFQRFITEGAWGSVWARPGLSLRERSLLTLVLLAGLGNFEEVKLHTRATANTGASREDILEAMLHVAVYAGVPRANHALKVIRETFAEMDREA